jgi:uncharacterized protein (DUF1800 family)
MTTSAERHLLSRATYGANAASLAAIHKMGTTKWLEWQLNPSAIKDTVADSLLKRLPIPSDATPIWKVNYLLDTDQVGGYEQLISIPTAHMIRAIWSQRQVLTVMEELWSDLFNVTVPHDGTAESRAHYQYTIRRNSLGKFSDLLWAITHHPAMLTYLNNRDSTRQAPNENQGRELLELHSVGVNAGYTEKDVLNSARILSGLSVSSDSGEYEYRPWQHWTGAVKVFGFKSTNKSLEGGEALAQQWVRYLAHHPATAQRVATKLLQRFVTETPSKAQIASLAHIYLANDTAIKPMLRAIFHSSSFAASKGRKVKRPIEYVASTVRLLEAHPESVGLDAARALANWADAMGQQPFGWPMPNGYSDIGTAWLSTSTMLNRWNAVTNITHGWYPNSLNMPDLVKLLWGTNIPTTHGALIDAASKRLFGRTLSTTHRNAILTFLGVTASTPVSTKANNVSPSIDWQLGSWVSLLLDSPYHLYR